MKNIFVTDKLSTGSMYRRIYSREKIEKNEFFAFYSFPMEIDGALLTIRTQLN